MILLLIMGGQRGFTGARYPRNPGFSLQKREMRSEKERGLLLGLALS